jgi:hypothetical protein
MIGRFLCRIGAHRWDYLVRFNFATFEYCGRCKSRRAA